MEKNDLVDKLTKDIFTYVMHGEFPEEDFAESLKPTDLNSRFEEYEKLMDFHFVLREEVVGFVKGLENELRSISTETRNKSRVRRGSVDGRIDWNSTIQERYSRNPGDSSLFVCENKTERYDTAENIVLKKFLSVIYKTLKDCEDFLENNHKWSERWKGEKDLVEDMKNIFERNVHVKRIKQPGEYEPTERMLNSAENSRKEIYRESARLLRKRDSIFSGDKDEIRDLLNKTAIKPDDEETLLELFVLFRFISTIEKIESQDFSLNTIQTGSQKVAYLENDEREISIYHDSSTDIENLKFKFNPENDVKDREYSRPEKVEIKARETIENYFDKGTAVHTGRPDVILVEIKEKDSDKREFFITEVKNSTNEKTIRRGIKEALEYLAFLRDEDDFIYDREALGGEKSGLLVIQDFEDEDRGKDLDKQEGPIRIVEASKLGNKIKDLIQEKISI